MLKFLMVYFPWVEQRINKLHAELNLNTYLEIGLGTGDTFNRVLIPNKVGVDLRKTPQVPDHEHMSSDEYFKKNWDAPTKFDLIFIDGCHRIEYAYRDFINSIRFSHEKTIWIIDDTVPRDAFSAMRDPEEAVALRKRITGSDNPGWHGDTYKLVWMIKAFHHHFKLMTIEDSEWKQTFLFQQTGGSNFNMDLIDIANLSYTDILLRDHEYNYASEEAVLAACINFVKSY